MSLDPWTIGLEVVNFLVLVWLVERLLYRPVLGVIAARQAEIARLREVDEAAREAASREKDALDAERQGIARERARVLEDAHAQALAEKRVLMSKASEEAQRLLSDARARIAHERAEATHELRRKSADMAATLARSLLESSLPPGGDGRFLQSVCEHLKSMDATQRDHLRAGLENDAAVRVVTARPLDAGREAAYRAELADALGLPVEVEFAVDESLIAGLDLYAGGVVLRHSWGDALERSVNMLMADAGAGNNGHDRDAV